MAAETGWPSAVLLLGLFLWATTRALMTAASEGQPGAATIAATSAAALAVHSTVDYVLNFPVLVAAAAVVLGAGTADSGTRGPKRLRRQTVIFGRKGPPPWSP
jgi:hypothetical protein